MRGNRPLQGRPCPGADGPGGAKGEAASPQKGRWHLFLTGAVQHVGLRYTALYLCRRLKLTGWVKNLPDGRVELEVQGDVSSLRRFYMELKSHPPIRITHGDIVEMPLQAGERGFSVSRQETEWPE